MNFTETNMKTSETRLRFWREPKAPKGETAPIGVRVNKIALLILAFLPLAAFADLRSDYGRETLLEKKIILSRAELTAVDAPRGEKLAGRRIISRPPKAALERAAQARRQERDAMLRSFQRERPSFFIFRAEAQPNTFFWYMLNDLNADNNNKIKETIETLKIFVN